MVVNNDIEEIKNRLDIAEVIQGYLKLQKAGKDYKALCPFHNEKTPSFFVSPSKQIWHCFGCGKGGDIFKFIMEIENVDFAEALRILARKAGVTLKRQSSKLKDQRLRLYGICDLAVSFFQTYLKKSVAGQKVQNYLKKRGINQKSIEEWKIGYAPNDWHKLEQFLMSKGYHQKEIFDTGLIVKKENNLGGNSGFYDRFRNRIIFPIFDLNGQVIGFGGRIADFLISQEEGIAKYVNTPNTLIYDKSRVLYGLDKAKREILKQDSCLIAEGYTDVVMSHQAGVKNAIASSGTALTEFQLKTIKRYTENLVMSFDMDQAGQAATQRAIDLALQMGFNVKVISLPDNDDPAEFIKKKPKQWPEVLKKSRSIIEFYFDQAFKNFNPSTSEGKKKIAQFLLKSIQKIQSHVEQSHWIRKLSQLLDVSEKSLLEEAKLLDKNSQVNKNGYLEAFSPVNVVKKPRAVELEKRLLGLLLLNPSYLTKELSSSKLFKERQLKEIYQCFVKNYSKTFDLNDFKKKLKPEFSNIVDQMVIESEYLYHQNQEPGEELNLDEEFSYLIKELESVRIKEKLKKVEEKIKKAEQAKKKKQLQQLLNRFKELSQKLTQLLH